MRVRGAWMRSFVIKALQERSNANKKERNERCKSYCSSLFHQEHSYRWNSPQYAAPNLGCHYAQIIQKKFRYIYVSWDGELARQQQGLRE
jgi:hypothetical protein